MKKIMIVCCLLLLFSLLLHGELLSLSPQNNHRSYRPVDKLFTAFVYTPMVQYKIGPRKRDRLIPFKEASAVMGYCLRHYEIGLGYDLTETDYCGLPVLPSPKILSIQAVSSTAAGQYSRQECDAWDMGARESQRLLMAELQQQPLMKNSRETLAGLLRVLCPEEVPL